MFKKCGYSQNVLPSCAVEIMMGVRWSQQETVKCSDYFLLKAPVLNKSDFEEFGVYFLGVNDGKRLYLRQWGKEEGVS